MMSKVSDVVSAIILIACCFFCLSKAKESVVIKSMSDFVDFADSLAAGSYDEGVDVSLNTNLDFTDVGDISFPLGDYNFFTGTFDGKGHSISNLILEAAEDSGLFYGFKNAVIKNLVIDKTCSFTSIRGVAALSSAAEGNLTLQNVINEGSMMGLSFASGLVGELTDAESIIIDGCQNKGSITLKASSNSLCVSGFVANVASTAGLSMTVRNSINKGKIYGRFFQTNQRINIGGLIGQVYPASGDSVTVTNCTNEGEVAVESAGASYCGGFIGRISSPDVESFLLNISNCSNRAKIGISARTVSCGGGIISQITCPNTAAFFDNTVNYGNVEVSNDGQSTTYVGGLIGTVDRENTALIMNGCSNNGAVSTVDSDGSQSYAAGLIGILSPNDVIMNASLLNCKNTGHIKGIGSARGLFNNGNRARVIVENSVNRGFPEGKYSNSIGTSLFNAVSVASTPEVSLWDASTVYERSAVIVDNTPAPYEFTNGVPYVKVKDDKMRLDQIFNERAEKENGWFMWSSNLDFTDSFFARIKEGDKTLVNIVHLPFGYLLGDIPQLRVCFAQEKCSIIDSVNGTKYSNTTVIHMDMYLDLTISDNDYSVIIDINPTDLTDVDINDLIRSLANISDIDVSSIIITVETNDNGEVKRVVVHTNDEKSANNIVISVNDHKVENSDNDIVRKMKKAELEKRPGQDVSDAFRLSVSITTLIVLLLLSIASLVR